MSTHKNIDRICIAITIFALLVTVLFMNGKVLGIQASSQAMAYEETLFDTSKVHTIDIIIDDWDAFLQTATNEEYSICSVVIDNDAVKNFAMRITWFLRTHIPLLSDTVMTVSSGKAILRS